MKNYLNRPFMTHVTQIVKEALGVITLFFRFKSIHIVAGQYIMVWIPGVGEKPMSISYKDDNELGITVAKVGKTTSAIHELEIGSKIGIRGPYGNGFKIDNSFETVMVIGGGMGIAPLGLLVEQLVKKGVSVKTIIGGKTKSSIFFLERMKKLIKSSQIYVTTEDGSMGYKGLATDLTKELIEEEDFDCIFTCGPELMMKKVLEMAQKRNTLVQASLERWIKCAIGICGQCVIDPLGIRVCIDGPVFDTNILSGLTDFGRYTRDPTGKKIKI